MICEVEQRIIFADTDAMGIVYNGRYVEFMERGRTELMREMGYPYSKLEDNGVWLPVAKLECKYKTPARTDDILIIRTRIGAIKGATIEIHYQIVNKETGDVCVEAKTVHPATDSTLKPVRFKKMMPELYQLVLENLEESF